MNIYPGPVKSVSDFNVMTTIQDYHDCGTIVIVTSQGFISYRKSQTKDNERMQTSSTTVRFTLVYLESNRCCRQVRHHSSRVDCEFHSPAYRRDRQVVATSSRLQSQQMSNDDVMYTSDNRHFIFTSRNLLLHLLQV